MEDELGERPVEGLVLEGQRLGRRDADVRAGHARAALLDERLRRIDGRDVVGADDAGEDGRQRAGAAADVEDVAARRRPPRRGRTRARASGCSGP